MAFLHEVGGNVGEMYVDRVSPGSSDVKPGSTKSSPVEIEFSDKPVSVMLGILKVVAPGGGWKLTVTFTSKSG